MTDGSVMKICIQDNNIILDGVRDFELRHIFECGQCFRWNSLPEGGWFGTAYGRALLIEQNGGSVVLYDTDRAAFDAVWRDYFDLSRDYGEIKQRLSGDAVLAEAAKFGGGIRILRQEPFEMLISYIISASNNIPRIKGIIERLCENFGETREYMSRTYYTFPTAEKIAALTPGEISVIRAGFREKYILAAARGVADGSIDLAAISALSYSEAKSELMKITGVGSKVSDCILLFGMAKTSGFPIDVWIKRIMEHCYFDGGERQPGEIAALAQEKFGELGGFAQQYLFYWARENKIGV